MKINKTKEKLIKKYSKIAPDVVSDAPVKTKKKLFANITKAGLKKFFIIFGISLFSVGVVATAIPLSIKYLNVDTGIKIDDQYKYVPKSYFDLRMGGVCYGLKNPEADLSAYNAIDFDGSFLLMYTNSFKGVFSTNNPNFTSIKHISFSFKQGSGATGITRISEGAFANCDSLESVDMKGARFWNNNQFNGCTNLKTVILSGNIENIPNSCFQNCQNLIDIDLSHIVSFGSYSFDGCASLDLGKQNFSNGFFFDAKPSINSGSTSYLFANNKATTEVSFMKGRAIYGYTFYSCENLKTIDFGDIADIDDDIAYNSPNLTNIIVRQTNRVVRLSAYTFSRTGICDRYRNFILDSTNIASGGFAANIFVPESFLSEYQSAAYKTRYGIPAEFKFQSIENFTK